MGYREKDVFLDNLHVVRPECKEELNSLLNVLSSADGNEENVNKAVNIFVETVRKAADPLFKATSSQICSSKTERWHPRMG